MCFAATVRSLIADYGVPLMIVVWTALSYTAPSRLPSEVPRRLIGSAPWKKQSLNHWSVIKVTNTCIISRISLEFVAYVMLEKRVSNTFESDIKFAGHGEDISGPCVCCLDTSSDDRGIVLLRPQCRLTNGSAEGIQSAESSGLSL